MNTEFLRCPEMTPVNALSIRKRCIREDQHRENHVWIEALNVVGRAPLIVSWVGPKEYRMDEIALQSPARAHGEDGWF